MRIGVLSVAGIPFGKYPYKDPRLDDLHSLEKSQKKTYAQVEFLQDNRLAQAEAIIVSSGSRTDLILADLEFVESRLQNTGEEEEKTLLDKFKSALEKEKFISELALSPSEAAAVSTYGLLTAKPVFVAGEPMTGDIDALLGRALKESGRIVFFTVNEREARSWLIKEGISAWEAAGLIHSDIQRGFIRAEVIHFKDFLESGGINKAKQSGHLNVEQKEYKIQDGDIVNFRFNK